MTPLPPPFVDPAWVRAQVTPPVLAEVRWDPGGRPDGAQSPLVPGAVVVDLDADLSAPASAAEGRHPLPTPEAFAAAMERLGIGDAAVTVAYDNAGGVFAARMVWMLRAIGVPAALLDGGASVWSGSGTSRPPASARFRPRAWPAELLVDADLCVRHDGPVLDARPGERFRGDPHPLDPRPGHIPGAVSVPSRENVDDHGRLRPDHELRARFEAAGVEEAADVVCYCGSGVTACHNLLTMEQIGLGRGRLYPGSWSQYAADPTRTVQRGADDSAPGPAPAC